MLTDFNTFFLSRNKGMNCIRSWNKI